MGDGFAAVGPQALGGDASLELLDNVGCGIWAYDGEDILYVNHALEELTGYSRAELMAPQFFRDLVHQDDRDFIVARGRARISGEDVPEQYEIRIVTASGAIRTLALHAKRVSLGSETPSLAPPCLASPEASSQSASPKRSSLLNKQDAKNFVFLRDLRVFVVKKDPQYRPTDGVA